MCAEYGKISVGRGLDQRADIRPSGVESHGGSSVEVDLGRGDAGYGFSDFLKSAVFVQEWLLANRTRSALRIFSQVFAWIGVILWRATSLFVEAHQGGAKEALLQSLEKMRTIFRLAGMAIFFYLV